jgi:membrane associated rhomboid family serine protease
MSFGGHGAPAPLSDRPVVRGFLLLIGAGYVASLLLDGVRLAGGFSLFGPTPIGAFAAGSCYTPLVLQGEWERVAASAVLHGGLLHLLFNATALLRLGSLLEASEGSRRTMLVFGLSQAGAAGAKLVADGVFGHQHHAIGASGVVCGVAAALWVRLRGERRTLLEDFRREIGAFLVASMIMGLLPGISLLGHLGGAIGGGLGGALLAAAPLVRLRGAILPRVLDFAGYALVGAFLFGVGTAAVRAPARAEFLRHFEKADGAAAQLEDWFAGAPFDPQDRDGYERVLESLGERAVFRPAAERMRASFQRFVAAGPDDESARREFAAAQEELAGAAARAGFPADAR